MSTQVYPSSPPKTLAVDLASTDSTIIVTDIEDWGGTDLTTAHFPGDYIPATLINDAKTKVEFILITASTITSAATTGATIFKRGLKYYAEGVTASDQTEVTANKLDWTAGETKLLIGTNPPNFVAKFANKDNAETIAAVWTFTNPNIPKIDTYSAPTADTQLATKKYVDDTATGSTINYKNVIVSATAGETVAAGEAVYFDETADEWLLTDADTAAKSENIVLGIAQGAGTDGNAITGGVLLFGRDENQTGLIAGDRLYLSATAGAIVNSAPGGGANEIAIGHAISATVMDFNPRFDTIPTNNEKDALVGDSGTPSTNNLYITELGLQRSVEVYAVDAEASDTYVVTLDPVPAAYVAGMTIRVKFNTANTAAATINVNGLGAKNITKNGTTALQTGDISVAQVGTLVYDGTQFQLQGIANTSLTDGGDASALHTHSDASRRLATVTSDITITNTTDETNVISFSLAGGLLSTDNVVRIRLNIINQSLGGGGTITFALKYGTTTIASFAGITSNPTLVDGGWIEAHLIASGATNTQEGFIECMLVDKDAGASNVGPYYESNVGTATEDSTGALTVAVTVKHSAASASNTITISSGYAELIR